MTDMWTDRDRETDIRIDISASENAVEYALCQLCVETQCGLWWAVSLVNLDLVDLSLRDCKASRCFSRANPAVVCQLTSE